MFVHIRPAQGDSPPSPQAIAFNRDIRPILSKNCFACHGPDQKSRKGDLRLDTRAGATAKTDGKHAIVPGDSGKSELYRRVTSRDKDVVMPPPDSGFRLTDTQKLLLKKWIDGGAAYALHWSFQRPVRSNAPITRNRNWPRTVIDGFVLARIEAAGLRPADAADRYQLVRRVTLDLVGIPPTIAETDRFVRDASPDSYPRLVDRLLGSPRYGERWASVWLDLARYADTQGYEKDADRSIWLYRDWVIRAFNSGMTFDDFTIRQIAGDLLPEPTQDTLIATGFHRNTMTNTEGGTDDEEFRSLAVKDRIQTTMQTWMGLTFGCAQCHDHKFDPISNEEFYRFYAFFNQTQDADRGDDRPRLKVGKASTLVMRELPANKRRKTRIHTRGNFRNPGKTVVPGTPESLHPLRKTLPRNRLGVAKWLVDPQNPLTARVTVNRIWARLFGIGLVETEEDFGTQGKSPSHPKLLDWLATELVRLNWDTKALVRLIVTSSVYRQSSNVSKELYARDRYNRLLARGPRFRNSAEVIRDQALSVAGLLSQKMYGRSVMPPQPDGVWRVVYNGRKWVTSRGQDRYRRALYTFRRRTSPYPSMLTFDAGSGETCLIRRIRTNSPLQALVTLNDPVYVEAAFALAGRVINNPDTNSLAEKMTYAFRTCLVRHPSAEESTRLQ
ncbi:MAG: PSD1 domain-containing protein, partial [Planctomycetes bacterium]|nr:PSD1 domain-containing protein [Planctomycetota bacterium]